MRIGEVRLRKLKLRLRDTRFANHKTPLLPFGSNRFIRSWLFGAVAPRIYLFLYHNTCPIWLSPMSKHNCRRSCMFRIIIPWLLVRIHWMPVLGTPSSKLVRRVDFFGFITIFVNADMLGLLDLGAYATLPAVSPPGVIWPSSKTIFVRLRTATVSGLRYSRSYMAAMK